MTNKHPLQSVEDALNKANNLYDYQCVQEYIQQSLTTLREYIAETEGKVLVPIDLILKTKVLINFHVKRGACIDINDALFKESDIYSELNRIWINSAPQQPILQEK